MKKLSLLLLVLVFNFTTINCFSQFTVDTVSNATLLAQQLAGTGVFISNATINCSDSSSGVFSGAPGLLGFEDGVILSTGSVIDLPGGFGGTSGINNPQGDDASSDFGRPGDADLDALYTAVGSSTTSSNDACALEFDIEVTGDSLKFSYAFGSEEYDEWVCNQFADIFAFFISGPNPAGGNYVNENIALVPGTNVPVTVNTVNNGSVGGGGTNPFCDLTNSTYFINQAAGGGINGIVYDGMTGNNSVAGDTLPLQAKAATVPCQTYHFKLVIADGQDGTLDSGVFLEAGSFSSNAVIIGASSVLGDGFDEAIEGCVDGVFSLTLDSVYGIDVKIGFDISGTATNGVDYAFIPDSVLVPAGDSIVEININVIVDGITEGTETVVLTPYTDCGTLGDPSSLDIVDDFEHTISISDTVLCSPSNITLSATGAQFYHWSDSTMLQFPDSSTTSTNAPVSTTTSFYLEGELGTCTFFDTVTVEVSQSNPTFQSQPISCPGANDGKMWVELNPGANTPFTYSWAFTPLNTDSFLNNISSAPPGFQIVSATDALGCQFNSGLVSFTDPAAAVFDYDSIDISCPGADDGGLCVYNIPNGTYTAILDTNGVNYGNYAFTINNDTFCVTGLGPNTYDFSFTNDTSGCGNNFTATLTDPNGLAFDFFSNDALCNGSDDGEICIFDLANGNYTASASFNGIPLPPYNFTINSDTFCIGSLVTGVYNVTITNNATLCSGSFTTNISEPQILDVSINVMGSGLCAGGSIDSLVSVVTGGTTNYTYLWNTTATTENIYSVAFGTYSVVVTDANNCTDTAEVTLIPPTPIYLSIAQDSALCFGENSGSAYVDSISGGNPAYTYSWNDAGSQTNDTAFNLTAGEYVLTATDINGCTALDTINVLEPAGGIAITLTSNTISCFGGDTCINATISGGQAPYTFAWNDAALQTTEDVCGIVAGTYTLTVTDAKGCINTETIIVTEEPEITLIKDSTNIACFAGSTGIATVIASGGSGNYTYQWDDAAMQTSASATNLVAGLYTVVVSDAVDANCTKTISINLTEPADSLQASLNNLQNVLCNGASTGSIDVDVFGGTSPYNFAWSNTTNTEDINNVAANNYTLTVTDANNCTTQYADVITQPTALAITQDSLNPVSCFGGNDGSIYVSVSGGIMPYTYAWSNTANTDDVTGLAQGSYTLTVTDSNNCVTTRTFQITEPSTVAISFNYSNYTGFNVSCNGSTDGTIEAIVSGGNAPYTYAWDNSSVNNPITGLGAGTVYTVTVTDNSACTFTQAANMLNEPLPISIVEDSTGLSCAGYNDGIATATVTGGAQPYSFLWSDPAAQTTATASGLAAGTYNCNISDANGCSEIIQISILEPQPITVVTNMDSVNCWGEANGEIEVVATGGNGAAFEYSLDNGASFQSSNTFTGLTAGIYNEIIVRQGGISGCLSVAVSETVEQPEPMFVFINPEDITVQLQDAVPLTIVVDPSTGYFNGTSYTTNDITSVNWSPTSGLDCTDCLNPNALVFNETEYIATVLYSEYSCETSASATINVENNLKFFIPNSFSPNGDGINDVHFVYGEALRDFQMSIYNRIGEKVFESNIQGNGWDGTFKGEMQSTGVYTFFFKATYLDDKEIDLKGSITLLR
ncbi:MAG: choice-of-anchor L domain-containing protein [Chitinophagales bacterium]